MALGLVRASNAFVRFPREQVRRGAISTAAVHTTMGFKQQYENGKAALLADAAICEANRELFAQFFEFEEYKLKRQNGLRELDNACFKTLYGYLMRFRNVNAWFGNKPWSALTKDDIKQVYDDLEDGRIKTKKGIPFTDRQSYYNKVFKSKPFRLAGKSDLAKDVIEFSTADRKEVRFVTEEAFRTLVSVVSKPHHLLLFWLAWDIGENVDALLKLTKQDFVPQVNRYTQEREYLVNLPQNKIKRSRRSRSEPTLYPETVRFADMVLVPLGPQDKAFNFEYRQALKLMHTIVRKTQATTMPSGQPVRWKDLRSGMACHLLRMGWSSDEVNARLGHTPRSDALDAYINYLAIDRERPKQKLVTSSVESLQRELADALQTAKLAGERTRRHEDENHSLRAELAQTRNDVSEMKRQMERVLGLIMKKAA